MTDLELIQFIYNRLFFVYNESPHVDYMRRLKKIIDEMKECEELGIDKF